MIYIEVRFGAINGNALTVDSALSETSENPVQNKVISREVKSIREELDAIAGTATKDVIEVETYDDLADIEEPSSEVIYITADTSKLYLYDASRQQFNEVTNQVVDNTINVSHLNYLLDMQLNVGDYLIHCVKLLPDPETEVPTLTIVNYTLSVSMSRSHPQIAPVVMKETRRLAGSEGYAVKVVNEQNVSSWLWTRYSVEGHTHTTSDITGLSDAISSATTTKQDKTDNNLQTTNKTVVGAINEVKGRVESAYHSFTIDFQDARSIVQMRAVAGAITMTKISTDNVATLKVTINGTQQTLSMTDGVWTGSISVPADALLVWNIGRTTEGSVASINIKYNY